MGIKTERCTHTHASNIITDFVSLGKSKQNMLIFSPKINNIIPKVANLNFLKKYCKYPCQNLKREFKVIRKQKSSDSN